MADNQIVQYVNEQLEKGFTLEEVRNYLVIEGYYPSSDVDEAINFIKMNQQNKGKVEKKPNAPPDKKDETNILKPKNGRSKKKIIVYIFVAIFSVIVVLKVLAYLEIFDAYAMIGFDPFTEVGNLIRG